MKFALYVMAVIFAAAPAAAETTTIHAGILIQEAGKPALKQQTILVENGIIKQITAGYSPAENAIDLSCCTVMPGLIDMHSHVTLLVDLKNPIGTVIEKNTKSKSALALGALPTVKAMLDKGFTTVRNLGDPAGITYDIRNAIMMGIVDGPRIIATEPQIHVSGGDYDPAGFGLREGAEEMILDVNGRCDGPIDCRRVVRREIRRGANVIKLRFAGAALVDPNVPSYEFADEINAIVETAHRLNRKVAAHVNTPEGVKMAVEAGVDTIEHGPLTAENVALMKLHGVAYTPTLLAAFAIREMIKRGLGRDLYAEHVASLQIAYNAGVPIIFGSDLGVFGPDRVPEEFRHMVDAGMTPSDALRAATINAATALGLENMIGTLEPNKQADLVATEGDPLANVDELNKVIFVMRGGKVYKNDRAP